MTLHLAAAALDEIRGEAARAYPHEGCGALCGRVGEIVRTIPIENVEDGAPRTRFRISPRDYIRVESEAEGLGLTLLGFWHSHPDHPARPSETDRAYAWEGLLTAVIAVEKGEPREVTFWEVKSLDAPFTAVPVEVEQKASVEV